MPEFISMDATVLTLSAMDRDSEHNGMISYKILSSSEGFSIDHKNGESVSMVYYFSFLSINRRVLLLSHMLPVITWVLEICGGQSPSRVFAKSAVISGELITSKTGVLSLSLNCAYFFWSKCSMCIWYCITEGRSCLHSISYDLLESWNSLDVIFNGHLAQSPEMSR